MDDARFCSERALIGSSDDFWVYSCLIYRRPGLESQLIALQDDHGLDVNLVLLCCWLADSSWSVCRIVDLRIARAAIRDWMRDVVIPLRTIRRNLRRPQLPASLLADVESSREGLKAAELQLERVAQRLMVAALSGRQLSPAASPQIAVAHSFTCYAASLRRPAALPALLTLGDAVFGKAGSI